MSIIHISNLKQPNTVNLDFAECNLFIWRLTMCDVCECRWRLEKNLLGLWYLFSNRGRLEAYAVLWSSKPTHKPTTLLLTTTSTSLPLWNNSYCLFLNFTVFFSKICDFVVKRVLNFRLRFNMVNYAVCSFTRIFITGRENARVILSKRQRCERRNFRKIAIFNHNFKNEKIA